METRPKTIPFGKTPGNTGTAPKTLQFNQVGASSPAPAAAAPAPEQDGFLETIIKDPLKTLLVKPAARTTEALGRLGLFGKTIKTGYEEIADSGRGQRILGMDIEKQRGFQDGGLKQIAGEALKTGSYLYGGGAAKGGAQTIGGVFRGAATPTARQAAMQVGRTGAITGAAYGAGEEMTQRESTLGSILAGGAVGGSIGAATGGALGAATPLVTKALSPAQRALSRKSEADDAVRRVLQGKTGDAEVAQRAFREIDTDGVRTNAELSQRLDEKITDISGSLDTALETNPLRRPLSNLDHTFEVNGQKVKNNYVNQAMDQLEKEYTKTNNLEGLATMQQLRRKAEVDGLTVKEINDLSRLHGQDLNAYLPSGKLSSGLAKQTAENTRAGLKSTSRNLFGDDIAKEADARISDLIRVRKLINDRAEAVNKVQAKMADPSIAERVGGLMEQALNIATLGTSRGVAGALLRTAGKTNGRLDALQLEKRLAQDLKLIEEAAKDGASEATIVRKLEQFITEAGETPMLQLEAPRNQSQTLFGTPSGRMTNNAQEAADIAAVEAGRAAPPPMGGPEYQRKVREIQNRLEPYLTDQEMAVIQMGPKPRANMQGLPAAPDTPPNVYANPAKIDAALQRKLERYLSPEEMEIIQMGSGKPPRTTLFEGEDIQF